MDRESGVLWHLAVRSQRDEQFRAVRLVQQNLVCEGFDLHIVDLDLGQFQLPGHRHEIHREGIAGRPAGGLAAAASNRGATCGYEGATVVEAAAPAKPIAAAESADKNVAKSGKLAAVAVGRSLFFPADGRRNWSLGHHILGAGHPHLGIGLDPG